MSKLLIQENPLQVLPTLAEMIGLNEAIVLQQVHYWIENAKRGENKAKYRDGKYWVYNTYQEWETQFPFWSPDTIKRTFLRLENLGLILAGQFEGNHRRKWYTIDYDKLDQMDLHFQQGKMPSSNGAKCPDATGQNAPLLNKELTETTSEITTDIKRVDTLRPDFSNRLDYGMLCKLPEIQIYRNVTGRQPGQPHMPIIYDAIRAYGLTEEDISPFWEEWIERGYNPKSLKWLTEWAVSGFIPQAGRRASPPPPQEYDPEAYTGGQYAEFIES